jgi:hypothetical protein
MEDFETTNFETTNKDALGSEAASNHRQSRLAEQVREGIRRFVLFVCCGPGVLGFLWLIGRILRR